MVTASLMMANRLEKLTKVCYNKHIEIRQIKIFWKGNANMIEIGIGGGLAIVAIVLFVGIGVGYKMATYDKKHPE